MTIPSPQSQFIDTHAHLDSDQFAPDRDAVIKRAWEADVHCIINIGYCPAVWASTLALAAEYDTISCTLGMHPHHAEEWTAENRSRLIDLLDATSAVAVGEIGIDLYRDGAPHELQRRVFDEQLDIAQVRNLPVVIHQRAAERAVLEVLQARDRSLRCVFHSFEGSPEMAAFGMERGYMFGVGGLMTRQSQESLRTVLAGIPLEHILLETDAPYLVPAGVRSRRNEPANIPAIAERFAVLRGLTVEDVAVATTTNAIDWFGLARGREVAGNLGLPR